MLRPVTGSPQPKPQVETPPPPPRPAPTGAPDGSSYAAPVRDRPNVSGEAPQNTGELAVQLEADRQVELLQLDPAAADALDALEIHTGTQYRMWIDSRLNAPPNRGGPSAVEREYAEGISTLLERAVPLVDTPGKKDQLRAQAEQYDVLASRPPTNLERAREALEDRISHGEDVLSGDPGDWDSGDVRAFSESLAREVEANRDNPSYVRTLLAEAAPGLEAAMSLMHASSEKNDLDKGDIRDTVGAFSDIAAAVPEEVARELAYNLADGLEDGRDLYQLDDSFYDLIEDGTDPKLFELTAAALIAQDKAGAADELIEKGGGLGDLLSDTFRSVKERFEDVVGLFGDVARGAYDFGADRLKDVTSFVTDAGELVLDVASNTLDFAGDVADLTLDQVQTLTEKAVELGAELAGPLLEKAREAFFAPVYAGVDQLNIDEKVADLGPGDELALGASLDATLGYSASAEGELSVTRNPEGGYTVSASMDASLGGKLLGGFDIGVGGSVEFSADSAEEAVRMAEALARFQATNLAFNAIPLAGPVLGAGAVGLDDASLLIGNISAVELGASAGVDVDATTGGATPFGGGEAEAKAGVEVAASTRLEFERDEDGNLEGAYLVREQELSGNVKGGASAELLEQLGLNGEASADVSYTATTRAPIELSGTGIRDVLGLVVDPSGGLLTGALSDDVTTSLSANVVVDGQAGIDLLAQVVPGTQLNLGEGVNGGAELSIDVADLDPEALANFGDLALQGRFGEALRALPDVEVSGRTYTEHGFDTGIDAKVAGQGVELGLYNRTRDYSERRSVTV